MEKRLCGCFVYLLSAAVLLAETEAQSISLTSPLTNASFASGDEYATTYAGNPWNMKQIRDIPYDLHFAEPTVDNNEWSSTFLGAGAAFYPLWRGFSTATTTSYPYRADGCMPLGALKPIDTAKYSRMSMRLSLNKADRSSFWIIWTTNIHEVEQASKGSMGFVDGDYCMLDEQDNPRSQMYPDGYRIYDLGFTVEDFFIHKVREPSAGFELYGTWTNKIYGFLVHPTLDGAVDTPVKVNWLRIYDPAASPKLRFTWNTTGVSTNDYLYGVQLWVDSDNSGYDGELFATCLKNSGAYEINTAALPAGNYYFYLKLVTRGYTEWTELARSAYSGCVNVTHPPSLEFSAPTFTSGDDYATVELGNPWDMADASDIYEPLYISNISFQNGVLIASADAPIPPATESDSQFYLNTKLNGEWKPIDATKYHYLTFRIMVDRTGYTNINDWVARGWLSRAVWFNEGIPIDGSEAQGIPLYENWHSYTVDLADRSLLTTENPYPAQVGWTELGAVRRFRFDPLEVMQATAFGVEDVKLCADNRTVNNRYTISWVSSDPDSEELTVALSYGVLSGGEFVGAPIAVVTQSPGSGSYVWDTSGVRAGSYYIQAVVSDGVNSYAAVSQAPVIVGGSGGGYFTLTNACALASDFDGDAKADPALCQEATGNWQFKLSSGGYALVDLTGFFGGTGYTALAGDFDGDGKADPAIYGTETGIWFVKLSGSGYVTIALNSFAGMIGYSGVAADFDGDGLADPSVCLPASGDWLIKLSGSGYAMLTLSGFLGGTGCTALAGDFDGDGLADPAVYNATGGTWQIKFSGSGYATVTLNNFLGGAGYAALAGDFDGDGKADPAVYQSATGAWQVRLSGSNYDLVTLSL